MEKHTTGLVNVLVLGSGGREHALAWKIAQSLRKGEIYVAPGNPGTAMLGCKNIPIAPTSENFQLLIDIAKSLKIGLVVVGPDNVLADGVVDAFQAVGIPIFGPTKAAARIEWSKAWAKKVMQAHGIPTARAKIFTELEPAVDFGKELLVQGIAPVVKADGLALGKGVRVCDSVEMLLTALDDFMVKQTLGYAGTTVVIEEKLEGEEISIHALCDGTKAVLFPPVRDHKTLHNGDKGPMTGGMGIRGPIPLKEGLMDEIQQSIVDPLLMALGNGGPQFVGCLYPGLMLTKEGPKVLEFNARLGDPETQLYMPLMEDDVDLITIFLECVEGNLRTPMKWKNRIGANIVLAAQGYPEKPEKGKMIAINPFALNGCQHLFHAGTAWKDGHLVTAGGRVLSVTTTVEKTDDRYLPYLKATAYAPFKDDIKFFGAHMRTDIVP